MITPGTDRLGYFGLQEGVERQNRAPPRSGLVQHGSFTEHNRWLAKYFTRIYRSSMLVFYVRRRCR